MNLNKDEILRFAQDDRRFLTLACPGVIPVLGSEGVPDDFSVLGCTTRFPVPGCVLGVPDLSRQRRGGGAIQQSWGYCHALGQIVSVALRLRKESRTRGELRTGN